MSIHSLVKIWVHLIWGTHNNERILDKKSRISLFHHLVALAEENGIVIEKLNVQPEHVHILFPLLQNKNIAQIAKTFKGESSHWINDNDLIQGKLKWRKGYAAFSVSASQLPAVKRYIENQDEHHRQKPFSEEYEEWAHKYGVSQK